MCMRWRFDPCAALPCATVKIEAKTVKALRDQTGAGMMDCKKALVEAEGDTTVALEALRARGLAQVDKKSGRAASEGTIETYIHTGTHVLSNRPWRAAPTVRPHRAGCFAQAQSWA